jgi:hypothetical protein
MRKRLEKFMHVGSTTVGAITAGRNIRLALTPRVKRERIIRLSKMFELPLPYGRGHGPARDEGDLEITLFRVLISRFQYRKGDAIAGLKTAPADRGKATRSCHDSKTG